MASRIEHPDDPQLDQLCQQLQELAPSLESRSAWPGEQLQACGEAGVFAWFFPQRWDGLEWSDRDLLRGYVRLAAACLTTTFVITQRMAACARLLASPHVELQQTLLPDLLTGRRFATVGLSHLTTSRRHLGKPALRAEETTDAFLLQGYSPWVTGGVHADTVVLGAELDDQRQVLLAVPRDTLGLSLAPPAELTALSASQTGALRCERVLVERRWLVAGPELQIMQGKGRAGTGGLSTSALAIGLARAALTVLQAEAERRSDLRTAWTALEAEWQAVYDDLLAVAEGQSVCSNEQLRARANSLVLRATQAALAAVKGAGYVFGHPVGRWCREALFFLVWSCPQPVAAANLCELAGLSD